MKPPERILTKMPSQSSNPADGPTNLSIQRDPTDPADDQDEDLNSYRTKTVTKKQSLGIRGRKKSTINSGTTDLAIVSGRASSTIDVSARFQTTAIKKRLTSKKLVGMN